MKINFVKTDERALLPKKNLSDPLTGDAGFDLFAIKDITISAGGSAIVPVGLKVGFITPGYWFRIEARSGLGFKKGCNPHYGVIDNSYRGDLGVKVYNLSDKEQIIEAGTGCAQLVVYKMIRCKVGWQDEVSDVEGGRGEKGFGSSDKKKEGANKHEIMISHEVPLQILHQSRDFNDYDYALVHLFEEDEDYFNFYKESVEMGRDVLLDNSLFELGKSFDADRYAEWISNLQPTRYIIPDVWGDSEGTIAAMKEWKEKYWGLPGKKIGVVQGKTYEELTKCYEHMAACCDEIAICFHYSYYGESLQEKMVGRQNLIQTWLDYGIITQDKPHHLLGCALPQEFSYYRHMKFIKSLDTSNPIIHGMQNIIYENGGLQDKSEVKLADMLHAQLLVPQLHKIQYNIDYFRNIVRG